jgi:murein DD-endopeptidase MepM/ murein hydrolase activator NlpD
MKRLPVVVLLSAAVVAIAYGSFVMIKTGTAIDTKATAVATSLSDAQVSAPISPVAKKIDPPTPAAAAVFVAPLNDALSRITKKPFGLYVRPGDSPVSPERFQGYHAGVDFETTVAEQGTDVVVRAICTGSLLVKKWASGYGGVAVQACRIGTQDVTVVYGHLRLASVDVALKQEVKQGERIGLLGTGFSAETDGERKHLHLGVHKGTAIDIRGYVQTKTELDQWIDVRQYLAK